MRKLLLGAAALVALAFVSPAPAAANGYHNHHRATYKVEKTRHTGWRYTQYHRYPRFEYYSAVPHVYYYVPRTVYRPHYVYHTPYHHRTWHHRPYHRWHAHHRFAHERTFYAGANPYYVGFRRW